MSALPYLNLGCGVTYDDRWTNIDFVSTGPGVVAHNLLSGIPHADETFEVVYHSHVLEHFPKDAALKFIRECHRVLKPGGVIRVAIPDLEQIVRNYITYLEEAVQGKPGGKEKYEWTVIEMLDQMVRNTGGGEMLKYIGDPNKNNDDFLMRRHGHEMERLFDAVRGTKKVTTPASAPASAPSLLTRAKNKFRRTLLQRVLKDEYDLLLQARFRNSGEIHQWMYDRFSLGELLKTAGFTEPVVQSAFESRIKNWTDFKLDGSEGKIRKPDSLFMEALKK